MSPLNRREFLLSSIAVSAATTLAPHLSAMSAEGARQPGKPVSQEARTRTTVQPQFARDSSVVNWREQGLNLGGKAFRDRDCIR